MKTTELLIKRKNGLRLPLLDYDDLIDKYNKRKERENKTNRPLSPPKLTRDLNIVMSDAGDMASYTQLLDFTFSVGGDSGEINNVRNSGVVKKINGEWKVVQIHWSIGVQGQAVEYEY